MTDWYSIFNQLSDSEKDKVAVLRVMECANGCIQYAFRDERPYALSLEDTRRAMKFSMGCMKTMSIPLKEETITFESETEEICRKVRELYISGFKNGNEKDLNEFMRSSDGCVKALGKERILRAQEVLLQNIDDLPSHTLEWGVHYLMQFLEDQ